MKTGKTSAATLGLVGGLVLGAWIGVGTDDEPRGRA